MSAQLRTGSWKSLQELKAGYTEAELKFEKIKQGIGLVLGPFLFFLFLLIPIQGLDYKAKSMLGVCLWTIVWWLSEALPIPVTSLVPVVLVGALGISPPQKVLNNLGNSTIWMLIGAFIIVQATVKYGLARRIALTILSSPLIRQSPTRLVIAFCVAATFLSAFMANIPVCLLMMGMAAGVADALGLREKDELTRSMLLGIAYTSQAGGFITPIGATGPNFLMITLLATLVGFQLSFPQWVLFGLPLGLVMLACTVIVLKFHFKQLELKGTDIKLAVEYMRNELVKLGKLSPGERNSLIVFVLVMVLWLTPGILYLLLGVNDTTKYWDQFLSMERIAIAGAVLLFLIPINFKERQFTMTWSDAVKGIDVGVLLLLTGGLVLAGGLQDAGLLKMFSDFMSKALSSLPHWVIMLSLIIIATFITQFITNIPCIAMMIPLGVLIAKAVGMNPIATAITLGIAAQQSYATPVCAPNFGLVYSTGEIKMGEFLKVGTYMTIVSIPVTLGLYYFASMLFPVK
ncbi:MAG: DASS family sodium-coupled anion symporter [Thermoanaerobacter sp.]|nr:DASS family sodium-coupled anion symporter [Thermoanaerobacter sp.]